MKVVGYMKLEFSNGSVDITKSWPVTSLDTRRGIKLYGSCYVNEKSKHNPYIQFRLDVGCPTGMNLEEVVCTIFEQLRLAKKKMSISLIVMEV